MMLSGCTWALLALGVVLTRRAAFVERWGAPIGPVPVGLVMFAELVMQFVSPGGDAGTRLLALLSLCGFVAWTVSLRGQARAADWGAVAWMAAGLLILGQSRDLLILGLGWELLRQGVRLVTTEDERTPTQTSALWLSCGWWAAVSGLLLFAGTTDLPTIMQVARRLYWPVGELEPTGRASLLLVGSAALWVLSVTGSMMLPLRSENTRSSRAACGLLHLQWGAAWLLAQWFQTGVPGLSGSLTVLMSVLIAAQWGLSMMALGRAERWGEILEGAVRFHGGLLLCITWTLMVPANGPRFMEGTFFSPAPLMFAYAQELLHGGVVITALLAALSWRDVRDNGGDYVEASRGAAACHFWSTAWVLLPLASLIGLVGVWGSWTRLTSGAAILSVHVLREDELAIPIGSLVVVALGGLISAGYLLRAGIHVVSMLCWEPLIGRPRAPGNGWPQFLAAALCGLLLIGGVFPSLVAVALRLLPVP